VAAVPERSGVEVATASNGWRAVAGGRPKSAEDISQGISHGASNPGNAIARRDRFIGTFIADLPPHALVVNVGCGVVRRFESAGTRYLATDLRVLPNVDFAADAGALPLTEGSADLVVALELLEHVPKPEAVLSEVTRVLKPGGTAIISVPSAVPRHDEHDYWRFTAQGLKRLGTDFFEEGEVHVFGGTFEALGYLAEYYTALTLHVLHLPSRRLRQVFPSVGYWLDRHNRWSTSQTALHTLAFDLLFVGRVPDGATDRSPSATRSMPS
jgi:SAM-dependent methyltransferase